MKLRKLLPGTYSTETLALYTSLVPNVLYHSNKSSNINWNKVYNEAYKPAMCADDVIILTRPVNLLPFHPKKSEDFPEAFQTVATKF